MKIAVIGLPRTATTVTCELLANKYQLEDRNYMIPVLYNIVRNSSHTQTIKDQKQFVKTFNKGVFDQLFKRDNFVVKYASSMWFSDIEWDRFDKIVFCSRANQMDLVKSMVYVREYHPPTPEESWFTRMSRQAQTLLEQNFQDLQSYSTDQDWEELVTRYWTLYQTFPKNLKSQSINVDEVKIKTVLQSLKLNLKDFEDLRQTIQSQSANCCDVTYEMWHQDPTTTAAQLSSALGVNVDSQDLGSLTNQPDGIDYNNCITNSSQIEQLWQSISID
jgi:hypothetical protein